jgi:hypothetical protein
MVTASGLVAETLAGEAVPNSIQPKMNLNICKLRLNFMESSPAVAQDVGVASDVEQDIDGRIRSAGQGQP